MSQYSSLAAFYDQVFPFRPAVAEFLEDHLPAKTAGDEPRRQILDVGCGPGHYAGYLSQKGHDAEGLDLDSEMIGLAKQQYSEQRFRVADMRAMDLPARRYDLIFCLGNTAAHLTRAEFASFARDLYKGLKPGGVWIVQVINWDQLLKQSAVTFPPRVMEKAGLTFSRSFCDITPERALFKPRLEREGALVFSEDVWLFPLPGAWLREAHKSIGFEVVAHYGDYDRSPFDPSSSPGNILACRRPTSS